MMIEVKNLTVKYRDFYVLNNISFSLNRGDSLGIIGKSGGGKSTLAKALVNIFESGMVMESGTILLNNVLFSNDMRGNTISLLFQNPNSYLNPLMKVGKQISEMLIYHKKFNKKEAKLKTIEFMKKLQLNEQIYDYYPFELSGGMQQKICLCICLICAPKVLILDESTSFLDSESKKEILHLIKSLQREQGFTLILISHDFNEIYTMCNKIAIIENGKMVEFGNKEEIISNPLHPHTIELLSIYLSYYENIEPYFFQEKNNCLATKSINKSHYFMGSIVESSIEYYKKIKEKVYEHLNS